MDTILKLTAEELERYAPYHTWSEFTEGFDDYNLGQSGLRDPRPADGKPNLLKEVGAQAYDRGLECAMRRRRKQAYHDYHVRKLMK